MSQRIPPAKGPAQTMVGLGAAEYAHNGNGHRDESPTPPSGITLPPELRMMSPQELALYAIEQVRETRDELIRHDANRKALDERRDGKIDALISDVRSVLASSRTRDEALFGLLGLPALVETLAASTVANQEAIVAIAGKLESTEEKVDALDKRIGLPPEKIDLGRASLVKEHTAEELTAMEREGTGLFAVVSRLVAGQSRMAKRVAIGAGLSAAATPVLIEIVKAIAGG